MPIDQKKHGTRANFIDLTLNIGINGKNVWHNCSTAPNSNCMRKHVNCKIQECIGQTEGLRTLVREGHNLPQIKGSFPFGPPTS